MRLNSRILVAVILFLFMAVERAVAQAPTITSISPNSGPVGSSVLITGTNFGATQGSSTISLNGTSAAVASWSATSILAIVPVGASSGTFSVTVAGQAANSSSFTVTSLPSGWSDGDVGSVGVAGSASYSNGTFTVNGAGTDISGTSDRFHFAYLPLSGDGSIVARVVSFQGGGGTYPKAGVMIRETLNANSTNALVAYQGSTWGISNARTSTGGSTTVQTSASGVTLPYWVKVVRSGNSFTGYTSSEGVNWTQLGTTQTITMTAQSVYIGLAVTSQNNGGLATATFDSVSINSSTMSAPSIANLSATTASVGTQVAISGSNFGTSQGSSFVMMNALPMTINFWSTSAIIFTIPNGTTSGILNVFTGLSQNASNSFYFTVESNPIPLAWLDADVGAVGVQGNASYSNGTFTIAGAGHTVSRSDAFHFAYLPLSGDGSITARVVTTPANTYPALVAIRETTSPGAAGATVTYYPTQSYLNYRVATSGTDSSLNGSFSGGTPYWFKLVRSGNSFSGFMGYDGVNWNPAGTVTITMAQNAFIGLGVSSGSTSSTSTVTFDNVEVSSAVAPLPTITTVSATTGSVGTQVLISGANFGATQGNSLVTLNGVPVTVNSWNSNAISVTISSGATSGPLLVSVAPSMDDSNYMYFTITANPLPLGWLDSDIGHVSSIGGATYLNGKFTVTGSGTLGNSADAIHFVYQPLSGDGTIITRIVDSNSTGVMIRENLVANSTCAELHYYSAYNSAYFSTRSSAGGTPSLQGPVTLNAPRWLKLTRSGNTFSGYISSDRINWSQLGTSVTFTMAQNAYVGLTDWTGTWNFDHVSIDSAAAPAPVITSVSATTVSIGSQVVISGSNFGASQGSSQVTLNAIPMTINSWSATSITATLGPGAASGSLLVSVGPSMNESNIFNVTVTSNPLLSGWLDQDVGSPGVTGNASYSSGTFTVSGAGALGVNGTTDSFHIAYQTLSGDGTIVARLLDSDAGKLMMRETLTPTSTEALVSYSSGYSSAYFTTRATTGATFSTQGPLSSSLPLWMKVTRIGNSFSGYVSPDGVYWTQIASSVTIAMAQTIYVGLEANSGNTTSLATAAFDNVSIIAGTPPPTPVVTGITPASGTIGTSVTVSGSNFGATQGASSVRFNGAAATSVTSWSAGQIVAAVPSNASTGPVSVVVNSNGSNQNYVFAFYNPLISSATPPASEVGGYITLSGSGLGPIQGNSQVQFNGVTATISSWSNTSVVAVVPTGATTGPITLTEGGITSNSLQFTVLESLSVSGLAPAIGPFGTNATITGAGFGPTQSNSTVSFYGALANIVSWSDTSIVATVPAAASTGNITVTVAGIAAQGPLFTLTNAATLTDSLGNTTTYNAEVVGGQWYVTNSQGSGCSSCTQRGTVSATYDSNGNVLTSTDELGHTTTYTYDSNGNVLSVSQPDGNGNNPTTTYTYNSFNEVLTTTDPLGNVTTNTYDANGNLLTVTTPKPNSSTAASVTTFTYDNKGELLTIKDPLNNVTTLTYTTAGLIATIKDAQNNVTTYGYDTHGNRTSVTDALSHQTTFAYDSGDRLTTITYPDSTTSTFAYDSRGRRTSVTDQNGKTTSYAYDDANRLTSVTDAASNVTTYSYDTENNLTSIKDASNNTTSFSYDAFGRVTQTTFPSGHVETYGYDANSNLTGKTDRKNQQITYTYDQLNRLAGKTYPDSSTVNYTYDLDSRLTQVSDPTGTYQFTFDNMGRLTSATASYTFLTGRNFTANYAYDATSNRTGLTDPENGSTTYTYDTLNRLQTLTPPSAFTTGNFGFSYDALSRRTQMTRPNSISTNYGYDNLSRLLSVLHQSGSTTLDGATYTVDSTGNRTSKTQQPAGSGSNFTYDALYELTQVTQGANTTESYSYDPVGNRTASLGVSSYATNASNEITSTSSTTYSYDANGNTLTSVTGSNTTMYAWDFENRLTSVTLPGTGGTVTFKYDPFGRRIYKSSSSATSIYAYDGDNLIEETNSSGAAVARYSQGLNIDEPLAMLRSSATNYYHADGLGSITSLSSGAGSLAQTYTFDSFGKQTASSGSLTNPFQYTGRESDSETGLYFYRARYYDPSAGRFLGEDPIRFSVSPNFYAYVSNDPMGHIDPSGLCPCGYHAVRLYLMPNHWANPPYLDYHWYRQDSNGKWSSKHGWARVWPQQDSNPDNDAGATGYTVFCGTMCASNQGGLVPTFNPVPWNDPGHVHTNNCYSYACDALHPPGAPNKPQPGDSVNYPLPFPGQGSSLRYLPITKCWDVISQAMRDGYTTDPFEPIPFSPRSVTPFPNKPF